MAAYETILTRLPAPAEPLLGVRRAMLMLGDVPFQAPATGMRALQRSAEYRHPPQDRIPERPALQFTGLGDDRITLDGVVFPGALGTSGLGHLRALRALAEAGTPRHLVAGTGEAFGRWVVGGLSESRERPHADGAPRRVAWTLRLERYGDDAAGGRLTALESSAAGAGDVRAVLDAATAALRAGGTSAAVLAAAEAAAAQT